MVVALIILGVGIFLYFISNNKKIEHNKMPRYEKLTNEDKLKVDLTRLIREVVEESSRTSKMMGRDIDVANFKLEMDINVLRTKLKNRASELVPNYNLSIYTIRDIIDLMCDGAIGTHTF